MDTGIRRTVMETGSPEGSSRTKSVLVVDSDYQETGAIRNSLEACGFDVSSWTHAQAARSRLATRSFDLLVLSTTLGKDAIHGFLEDLRSLRPGPKVILIMGEAERQEDEPGLSFLRCLVTINRPFQLIEVATTAETLLGVKPR